MASPSSPACPPADVGVDRPLRLCADGTVVCRLDAPAARSALDLLERVAERGPRDTRYALYRLTEQSLWQAAARGLTPRAQTLLAALAGACPLPLPPSLTARLERALARVDCLRLIADARGDLWLTTGHPEGASAPDLRRLAADPAVRASLGGAATPDRAPVRAERRAALRAALLRLGYPVRDLAPTRVPVAPLTLGTGALVPRPYQLEAADAAFRHGGGAVVVLPCGAGKTLVGALALARAGLPALIVVPHHSAARQWRSLLTRQLPLDPTDVAAYRRDRPLSRVTIVTYAMLAVAQDGRHPHLERLAGCDWRLVVYDEVHLLPAPVFALAAALPAARRLGLSATLVREDEHQADVLALVGPVVYAVDGPALAARGYLARARCVEVRVPLPPDLRERFLRASAAARLRIAAENPAKDGVAATILARHGDVASLVLGQYLRQLERLGRRLGAPVITGRTPAAERERLYGAFSAGDVRRLVLSRVGNLALDLPDATVAVQVSGAFGSRQEEAQRLGRILRPKADGAEARLYTVVTSDSPEESFVRRRARYLRSQGYEYETVDANVNVGVRDLP
jgi:DNA excision repair protein ERCC-3